MNKRRHIISTTQLPEQLLKKLAEHDIRVDVVPFITISTNISEADARRIVELASTDATVAFTSVNSVKAVVEILQTEVRWRIFCLRGATFESVKERFGEHGIAGSAADSSALVEMIKADSPQTLVFFCGNLRHDAIPNELPAAGIPVEEIRVYHTTLTPVRVMRDYDGILFGSPSSVESFFSLNKVSSSQALFAMGHTTAAFIQEKATNEVQLPDEPGKDALVDLVISYFMNSSEPVDD